MAMAFTMNKWICTYASRNRGVVSLCGVYDQFKQRILKKINDKVIIATQ